MRKKDPCLHLRDAICASMAGCVSLLAMPVFADGIQPAVRVDVIGHYETAVGTSDAASAGFITPQLLEDRPLRVRAKYSRKYPK